MSTSHFTMAKSSLTGLTPNLQTKTNTYSCHPIHIKRAIPFSLALRLHRICSTNETFTLRTNELIDYLYKRGYNRYFLQREKQRVKKITRTEALRPPDTSTLDKPEHVSLGYHLQLSPSFHLIHYSQTLSHPYFIPRGYNVFKAAPIVACRRSSNLSDFLVWAMSHNATSLGAHTHAEKTVSLANTYLTDKFHTHSTIQAKPDLSLITRGGR